MKVTSDITEMDLGYAFHASLSEQDPEQIVLISARAWDESPALSFKNPNLKQILEQSLSAIVAKKAAARKSWHHMLAREKGWASIFITGEDCRRIGLA